MLQDNEDRFREALKSDLGRPYQETDLYVPPYCIAWCARDTHAFPNPNLKTRFQPHIRRGQGRLRQRREVGQATERALRHELVRHEAAPRRGAQGRRPRHLPLQRAHIPHHDSPGKSMNPTFHVPLLLWFARPARSTEGLGSKRSFARGANVRNLQISAIAGGNGAVLKPSEQTPAFSALVAELVPKYLDPELFHVINGGVPETTRVRPLTLHIRTCPRATR